MRTERRRQLTAVHEAGHAVAAILMGIKIKRISVAGEAGFDGIVRLSGGGNPSRLSTDKALAHMVICLAGYEAARRGGFRSCATDWEKDRHDAISYALAVGNPDEVGLFLRIAKGRARRLIESRWVAVEVLAAALLENTAMDGPTAVEVTVSALAQTR